MRIAHVIDYFHTDVGYQEYYLAKCMAEAGHSVTVITSELRHHTVAVPGPDESAGAAALKRVGVEVVRLDAKQLGHDRAWLDGLEAALHHFQPDVVHSHGPFCPTALRVARLKTSLGYRLLVDNHSHEAIAPAATTRLGSLAYEVYRLSFGRLMRRAVDEWVAIGPYEARFLGRRMGLNPDQIKVVPLGFDPVVFNYNEERREVLRVGRNWDSDIVVAVTGKLHARKRVDLVAAACAEMYPDQPVRLVLAGNVDEDVSDSVSRLAGNLEATGRLEILPLLGRADLADVYLGADLVVFPRLPSISIYEATGSGARVLVGDDAFSRWLHKLYPGIEAQRFDGLPFDLTPASDRGERARKAARVFAWPLLAERFVSLYAGA